MPARSAFDSLAEHIIDAYEFSDDHLYCFFLKNQFGQQFRINHPILEEPPYTDKVKIGEIGLREQETLIFLYDFGDDWQFEVELEKIDTDSVQKLKPEIIEFHGDPVDQRWFDD